MTELIAAERLAPYYKAARQEADRVLEGALAASAEAQRRYGAREPESFCAALKADPDVAVIAEFKRKSPSEGEIQPLSRPGHAAQEYQAGGAAALSVLTQHEHFGGDLYHIGEARIFSSLPILRKDFISEQRQLKHAWLIGAAAVLLIVAGLEDQALHDLHGFATQELGMSCLVEVHDEAELERALGIEPRIIGVNNRNLSTLQTDRATAQRLIPQIPAGIVTVAESGYEVTEPDHMRELRQLGVDAVLVGTSLMRQANPAQALRDWRNTDVS